MLGSVIFFKYTEAFVPPEWTTFKFDIPERALPAGNWVIGHIPLNIYNSDDGETIKSFFSQVSAEYIATKKEREPDKDCPDCQNFDTFHYDFCLREQFCDYRFSPIEIRESKAKLELDCFEGNKKILDPGPPSIIVLENLESKDQIYFSEPVSIPWDFPGFVKCGKEMEYDLELTQFLIDEPNKLIIAFQDGQEASWQTREIESQKRKVYNFLNYILAPSVAALIGITILILHLKKKRRKVTHQDDD